jgi:Holliday junction resolvase-like predicted endonuclease
MKPNGTEQKVKDILEQQGWHVIKPSYPDLLIWNDQKIYCLVEVKRAYNDWLSSSQHESFRALKNLDIPVAVIYLDTNTKEMTSEIKRHAHSSNYVDFITFQEIKTNIEKYLWRLCNNGKI